MFHRTNELATNIADAVAKKSDRLDNFEKDNFRNQYTIGNVFNASLLAWVRARAEGSDANAALDNIRAIFHNLRDIYIERNPHEVPLTQPFVAKFKAAPLSTLSNTFARAAANTLDSPRWRAALPRLAPYTGGAAGAIYGPDSFGTRRKQEQSPEAAGTIQYFKPATQPLNTGG
jgi:hypothetical protein